MLVSIIVNNFNYASFLSDAIESALQQDYPHLEVIVVDDGSTDNSRQIIASYGNRIIPIYKENGGQGSTFNTGFSVARGELICFLDADDVFLPNKVSNVVQAYNRNPSASLIYHPLKLVDIHNNVSRDLWPCVVFRGDIRSKVERAGGWWPRPMTSGLCPSRTFLRKVLPLPTDKNKLCADGYLAGLAPFFGPVIGLEDALAIYRLHDTSYWSLHGLSFEQECQRRLERLITEFHQVNDVLNCHVSSPPTMSLEDNLRYQQWRFAAGESHSRLKVIKAVICTQTLSISMKLREICCPMRWPTPAWSFIFPWSSWTLEGRQLYWTGKARVLGIAKV